MQQWASVILQQRQALKAHSDSGEIASRRMTPRARCVEVTLARCRITRLQVSGVDTATTANREVRLQLLIVDERDNGGEIAVRQRKGGHAPVWPTRSNERTESICLLYTSPSPRDS